MTFTETQLKKLGAHVVARASSHLHVHRSIPQDMQFFLAEVKDRVPQLVWIQYRGAGMPGRRTQVKAFRHYVADLLQAQPQALLLIEARSCDLPVREELMQHTSWGKLLHAAVTVRSCTLHTLVHCCGYAPTLLYHPRPLVPLLVFAAMHLPAHETPRSTASPTQELPAQVSTADSRSLAQVPVHPPAYPTDAALRNKRTTEERRLRRQPQKQEQHFDDCVSDFQSLLAPQVEAPRRILGHASASGVSDTLGRLAQRCYRPMDHTTSWTWCMQFGYYTEPGNDYKHRIPRN
eukprot:3408189-Amphidinium_carterae.1